MRTLLIRWGSDLRVLTASFVMVQISYVLNAVMPQTRELVSVDLAIYVKLWIHEGMLANQELYGVNTPWVYPVVALVPLFLAYAPTALVLVVRSWITPTEVDDVTLVLAYGLSWIAIAIIFNILVFRTFLKAARTQSDMYFTAIWLWFAVVLLMHGLYLNRVDGFAITLSMLVIPYLMTNPRIVTSVLTIAGWVKIWPAAIVAVMLVATRHRIAILVTGAATSVLIIAIDFALGGNLSMFSFVTAQTGRGLQIESLFALPWMLHLLPGAVTLNMKILTWEITGSGVQALSGVINYLMLAATLVTLSVALRAKLRGAELHTILGVATMGLMLDLIVFNKVGSPQYVAWLLIPLIILIVNGDHDVKAFTVLVLVAALLTGLIAPIFYNDVLSRTLLGQALLVLKAASLLTLWAYNHYRLLALGRRAPQLGSNVS